ncbi:MAG: glycosyltransferase family 9 protein [Verrucomicrobiota bacterium]|nr:glycosyltransferase family 9 protein [Verrucomicrobiota bacterium]
MRRILIVRGGAIGDFILTLPAIGVLRTAFPAARLEILGYRHIVALAEGRCYADAVRSIEYSALAGFFGKGAELAPELCDYFRSFDLIISYLFDPDGNFERNLRRSGVEEIIRGVAKLQETEHAALQLARVLDELGLPLPAPAAQLFPSEADREFARAFVSDQRQPIVALHPGSGSVRKNWPLVRWIELSAAIDQRASLLFVGGEADRAQLEALHARFDDRAIFAEDFPLPQLAAVLEKCALFIGHDSGISHIAAAVGTRSLLLFGATNPDVWAPANENVRVLLAPAGDLARLESSAVADALDQELMRIGIST